jgi:transcriptional regulator with XRE-family HTH domain
MSRSDHRSERKRFHVRQIKAARALLGITQQQLAEDSAVSVQTIKRLEARDGPIGGRDWVVQNLTLTLEACGIEFIEEPDGAVGVVYRKPKPKRGVFRR